MSSRYCPGCNTAWPDHRDFALCPRDKGPTREFSSDPDLSLAEAKPILQSYLDFDRFLSQREKAA